MPHLSLLNPLNCSPSISKRVFFSHCEMKSPSLEQEGFPYCKLKLNEMHCRDEFVFTQTTFRCKTMMNPAVFQQHDLQLEVIKVVQMKEVKYSVIF